MPRNDGTILMENVEIIFPNFSGRETQYNQAGARNFGVILDPDTASMLANDGWNVKELKAREADEDEGLEELAARPWLPVALRFEPIRPRVVLITSRGRTTLDESQVEMLDWADIINVDMIVRPSRWDVNGKSGIKAYVKDLYVTIQEDPLELKYSQLDSQNPPE